MNGEADRLKELQHKLRGICLFDAPENDAERRDAAGGGQTRQRGMAAAYGEGVAVAGPSEGGAVQVADLGVKSTADLEAELSLANGRLARMREYCKRALGGTLTNVSTFFARQGCAAGVQRGSCCCGCGAVVCCPKCAHRAWNVADTPLPTTHLDFLSLFDGDADATRIADGVRTFLSGQHAHEVAVVKNRLLEQLKSRDATIASLRDPNPARDRDRKPSPGQPAASSGHTQGCQTETPSLNGPSCTALAWPEDRADAANRINDPDDTAPSYRQQAAPSASISRESQSSIRSSAAQPRDPSPTAPKDHADGTARPGPGHRLEDGHPHFASTSCESQSSADAARQLRDPLHPARREDPADSADPIYHFAPGGRAPAEGPPAAALPGSDGPLAPQPTRGAGPAPAPLPRVRWAEGARNGRDRLGWRRAARSAPDASASGQPSVAGRGAFGDTAPRVAEASGGRDGGLLGREPRAGPHPNACGTRGSEASLSLQPPAASYRAFEDMTPQVAEASEAPEDGQLGQEPRTSLQSECGARGSDVSLSLQPPAASYRAFEDTIPQMADANEVFEDGLPGQEPRASLHQNDGRARGSDGSSSLQSPPATCDNAAHAAAQQGEEAADPKQRPERKCNARFSGFLHMQHQQPESRLLPLSPASAAAGLVRASTAPGDSHSRCSSNRQLHARADPTDDTTSAGEQKEPTQGETQPSRGSEDSQQAGSGSAVLRDDRRGKGTQSNLADQAGTTARGEAESNPSSAGDEQPHEPTDGEETNSLGADASLGSTASDSCSSARPAASASRPRSARPAGPGFDGQCGGCCEVLRVSVRVTRPRADLGGSPAPSALPADGPAGSAWNHTRGGAAIADAGRFSFYDSDDGCHGANDWAASALAALTPDRERGCREGSVRVETKAGNRQNQRRAALKRRRPDRAAGSVSGADACRDKLSVCGVPVPSMLPGSAAKAAAAQKRRPPPPGLAAKRWAQRGALQLKEVGCLVGVCPAKLAGPPGLSAAWGSVGCAGGPVLKGPKRGRAAWRLPPPAHVKRFQGFDLVRSSRAKFLGNDGRRGDAPPAPLLARCAPEVTKSLASQKCPGAMPDPKSCAPHAGCSLPVTTDADNTAKPLTPRAGAASPGATSVDAVKSLGNDGRRGEAPPAPPEVMKSLASRKRPGAMPEPKSCAPRAGCSLSVTTDAADNTAKPLTPRAGAASPGATSVDAAKRSCHRE
ncbi:hypothetical protein DIPPA_19135 [Diplonema papillatum]|nr:hypothetical protein DIPPA_19135 [Diplonema papillatum]